MRKVSAKTITNQVAKICVDANYLLDQDVVDALEQGLDNEDSPTGKAILEQIIQNAKIAKEGVFPLCQDTGFSVFFVELGQDVHIEDGSLNEAITEGVRKGYGEGYLRKSIVEDPLRRINTKDNTPPIIWTDIVPGDKIKITIAPKGGEAKT